MADLLRYEGKHVRERLLMEWSNVLFVAALLVQLSYATYTTQITNAAGVNLAGFDAQTLVSVIAFASITLFLVAICTTVLLTMALNTLPDECSILFVRELQYVCTIPEMATVSALYMFLINIFLVGMIQYGDKYLICAAPILAAGGAFVLFIWNAIILVLDRNGGLWEYSAALRELKAKAKRKELVDMGLGVGPAFD